MIAASLFIAALLSPLVTQSTKTASVFNPPIDALSIELASPDDHRDVRGFDGKEWTPWFPLAIEEEFDPLLRESNLVIFPREVSRVEVRNTATTNYKLQTTNSVTLHPLRVAKDLPRILSASLPPTTPLRSPPTRILSRKEWGADDSLLFAGKESQRSDLATDNAVDAVENGNGVVPERLREREEWQRQYPGEFRSARTVRSDANGQTYRWPLQYSPSVKLLVVHHTAQNVTGDERPPIERVRALYAYHADSRGWGDVGYHYIIDERGQIYEGRAGGEKVIGGHAYCWNTGTISVAMLGNFDVEQPKQVQMQSLQRLLSNLAQTYGIDLGSSVRMHGRNFPPIVGHRDLLSTDCPGYYVRETLSQVREHVWKGDILAAVRFPARLTARRADTPRSPISALVPSGASPLLTPSGITLLQGRPGMLLPFSVTYRGGQAQTPQLARIADVTADQGIFLWQERGKRFVPIRSSLQIPKKVPDEKRRVSAADRAGSLHLAGGRETGKSHSCVPICSPPKNDQFPTPNFQ
ncbi:N-acetylmuramoyl-L-alanine amidase [Candidatus Peregrinibacteria bacterium]|nr:N-acetylmuramoyl-L-alanine amidase [Candidatus Peregrinibacteria bacterium]